MNNDKDAVKLRFSYIEHSSEIVGVFASFVFASIIFILNHEPVDALSQIVLFMLFTTFLLLIGLIMVVHVEAFAISGRREPKASTKVKIINTSFISAIFLWLISVVILFFARNLIYLGVASTFLVAAALLLIYCFLWRPFAKGRSFI